MTPRALATLALAAAVSLPATAPAQRRTRQRAPLVNDPPSPDAEAQRLYEEGLRFYDADRFTDALDRFQRSFRAHPSPNSQLYVARCLRELRRDIEAVREYRATLRTAEQRARTEPRYLPTRSAAGDELGALRARVAGIELDTSAGPASLRVSVAGQPVDRAEWSERIDAPPGLVQVSAEAEGHEPISRSVVVLAGQTRHARFYAGPPYHPLGGWGVASIVGFGVAAVGVAGTVGFYAAAGSRHAELMAMCGMAPCPDNLQSAVAEGRSFNTLGAVSLGLSITGVALGAVFLALEMRPRGGRPTVRLDVASNGFSLGGTF